MTTFLEVLLKEMPSWFYVTLSLILLIAFIAVAAWIVMGAKRFADSLGKERKLYKLQEEVHELEKENSYNKNLALKLETVIDKSRLFLNTINDDDFDKEQIANYVQRIIESLTADVKTNAGEKHRCGFWMFDKESNVLTLLQGSSGFPESYIGKRRLGLDDSIAGRCFRIKETINSPDVTKDNDYEKSKHNYTSLICVPIDDFGVLTIDGIKRFDSNVVAAAQLYATIIENLLKQLYTK